LSGIFSYVLFSSTALNAVGPLQYFVLNSFRMHTFVFDVFSLVRVIMRYCVYSWL